jgi:hypothetical protein
MMKKRRKRKQRASWRDGMNITMPLGEFAEHIRTGRIDLGPVQHPEGLGADLEKRADAIWDRIGAYLRRHKERFHFDLCRDVHPERDIQIYEWIADAFDRYVASHPECRSQAAREEVVNVLEVLSLGIRLDVPAYVELLKIYFDVGGEIVPIDIVL